MNHAVNPIPSERLETRNWIGRIIIAVLLGEALWGLIISVMNNLIVPWLGDVLGQSSGLPTSFTQRPYNYPELFVSILEAGIAGLVAAILNYFLQRPTAMRVRTVKTPAPVPPVGPVRVFPEPAVAAAQTDAVVPRNPPPQPVHAQTVHDKTAAPLAPPVPEVVGTPAVPSDTVAGVPRGPVAVPAPAAATPSAPPPAASPAVKPQSAKAAPAKPKKQKEVYYNIVGEPMPSDDD